MSFDQSLEKVVQRFQELEDLLSNHPSPGSAEFTKDSKEYSDLGHIVPLIRAYQQEQERLEEAEALLKEEGLDSEMKELALDEREQARKALPNLEQSVKVALLPKDEADDRNVLIEFRAGTGGDEASLFAADLYRMYQRYAEAKGWRFENLSFNEIGVGGLKDATAQISGKGAFARLKFESGVHRVQRIPSTESGGRIHTSAATVAVMPEAEEIDVHIEEKDLRIDTFRAQGAGGQHVNTTDSAVRITHVPTGVVVSQQDEKSQHKNKAKALKILRSRLYEVQRQKAADERASLRKDQVGSGDRSERIRTYNFPQGRVTDHRINLTLYKLDRIMEGELDEILESLITEDEASRLSEMDV